MITMRLAKRLQNLARLIRDALCGDQRRFFQVGSVIIIAHTADDARVAYHDLTGMTPQRQMELRLLRRMWTIRGHRKYCSRKDVWQSFLWGMIDDAMDGVNVPYVFCAAPNPSGR